MQQISRPESLSAFLELFYPIHYTVGIAIEDTLRSGVLTRHQTAVLWHIHSRGEDGRVMRRKDVERALQSWFEITSSAVSKAIRSLAKPPHGMLELAEDPQSGREKTIRLTPRGERFILQMIENGRALMKAMVDHMTEDEINEGVNFLSRVTEIFETLSASGELVETNGRIARAASP